MGLLYLLLAGIAALIFLAVPFGAAVGYLGVLAWTALWLYLIFERQDPVSQVIEDASNEVQ